MMKNRLGFLILLAAPLISGCAGLQLRERDVLFEDPTQRLGIQEVQPSETEKAGVVLRLNPPQGPRQAHEDTLFYARVKNNRGVEIRLSQDETETAKPGSRADTYIDLTRTVFVGQAGEYIDEQELGTRGEIVKFIRGVHNSQSGRILIRDWKRTPILPAGPVRIGDTWDYEESMDARIEHWLVKEIDPEPYQAKAKCTLTGFALVKGKRVAVIRVKASQKKQERLKILFKRITMDINIDIDEVDYLDYAAGELIAKIMRTQSVTAAPAYGINDVETGQTVFFIP